MTLQEQKVIQFIKDNFTNEDGTIWHSDMQIIYNILNKEYRMRDIKINITFEISEFDINKVKEIIKQIVNLNVSNLEIKEEK